MSDRPYEVRGERADRDAKYQRLSRATLLRMLASVGKPAPATVRVKRRRT